MLGRYGYHKTTCQHRKSPGALLSAHSSHRITRILFISDLVNSPENIGTWLRPPATLLCKSALFMAAPGGGSAPWSAPAAEAGFGPSGRTRSSAQVPCGLQELGRHGENARQPKGSYMWHPPKADSTFLSGVFAAEQLTDEGLTFRGTV